MPGHPLPPSQSGSSETSDRRASEPGTYQVYWTLYGGARAVRRSRYPYVAVAFTAVCSPYWLAERAGERLWPQVAIDIIPGLMGFSLGGMAILLAFSNEKFITAIRQKGKVDSLFMKAVASFFHFLLVQAIALGLAVLSKGYSNDILSAVGFVFLSYGVLAALAIGGLLLQISRIFNASDPPSNADRRGATNDAD